MTNKLLILARVKGAVLSAQYGLVDLFAVFSRWATRQFSNAIGNLKRFHQAATRGRFDRAIDNLNRLLTAL